MVTVGVTEEFQAWFGGLSQSDAASVLHWVKLLELFGVGLNAPNSSALVGTAFAFRELRPKQGKSPLRVVYVFDPSRNAVLLVGGSKTDAKLYKRMIAKAEKVWNAYLDEK